MLYWVQIGKRLLAVSDRKDETMNTPTLPQQTRRYEQVYLEKQTYSEFSGEPQPAK